MLLCSHFLLISVLLEFLLYFNFLFFGVCLELVHFLIVRLIHLLDDVLLLFDSLLEFLGQHLLHEIDALFLLRFRCVILFF